MADYIFKNPEKLSELLSYSGIAEISGLDKTTNTSEFYKVIQQQPNASEIIKLLSKFFILKHFYDHAGETITHYQSAVNKEIKDLLGGYPPNECLIIKRKTGLKYPVSIITNRTVITGLAIVVPWFVFLIWFYNQYPDALIFTFLAPVNWLFLLFFPVGVVAILLPKLVDREKFVDVDTLEDLVESVYKRNSFVFFADDFDYLNEELNAYINQSASS